VSEGASSNSHGTREYGGGETNTPAGVSLSGWSGVVSLGVRGVSKAGTPRKALYHLLRMGGMGWWGIVWALSSILDTIRGRRKRVRIGTSG